jgi:hypothetical protein
MNNFTVLFALGSILLAIGGTIMFLLTSPHSNMECILYIMSLAILFGIWAIDSKIKATD